jgi:hypothetical protein
MGYRLCSLYEFTSISESPLCGQAIQASASTLTSTLATLYDLPSPVRRGYPPCEQLSSSFC